MRRGSIPVLLILIAIASRVSGAIAVNTCLRSGCGAALTVAFGGHISPRDLPRHKYKPAAVNLFGKIGTIDGTHPSALREAIVDIDKDVRINVKGYPVCKAGQLETRDTKAAMKVCGDAVVGGGNADIEIASPELTVRSPLANFSDLLENPLTVFNGGETGGKVKLLIHFVLSRPALTAVTAEVTIARKGSGLHSIAKVPVIADGMGSLIDFKFKLGKTYSYKGKRVGFIEARCPDGGFDVSMSKLLFRNEAHTPGVAPATVLKGGLTVPCTPKG